MKPPRASTGRRPNAAANAQPDRVPTASRRRPPAAAGRTAAGTRRRVPATGAGHSTSPAQKMLHAERTFDDAECGPRSDKRRPWRPRWPNRESACGGARTDAHRPRTSTLRDAGCSPTRTVTAVGTPSVPERLSSMRHTTPRTQEGVEQSHAALPDRPEARGPLCDRAPRSRGASRPLRVHALPASGHDC